MYCSPRLAMYGWTLRGPASRLPGSIVSPSSPSAFTACPAERFAVIMVAVAGAGPARGGFLSSTGASPPAAGTAAGGLFGAARLLRGGAAAALAPTRPGLL